MHESATTALSLTGQPAHQELGSGIRVEERRLRSGLVAVAVEMPHVHSAACVLYVRAGSRFETLATNGLGHFLEHMLFRGSARFPSSYELAAAVESLGASFNAATSRDDASYYIEFMPRHMEACVELLADMFRRPRFVGLETEREVILEEMAEDYSEKGLLIDLDTLTKRRLWPGHPMGYPIIGTGDNIRSFSEEHLRRHLGELYTAPNMILCGVGRIQATRFFAAAERSLDFLSPGSPNPVTPPPVDGAGGFELVENSDSQLSISLAWPALAEGDPDHPILELMVRLLDDGISSRLHRHIVDGAGLAYSIGAGADSYEDVGSFEVELSLVPEKLPKLVEVLSRVLGELKSTPPGEQELQKVKQRSLADLEFSQDEIMQMAHWFGRTRLYRQPRNFGQVAARLEAVTPDEVRAMAERILVPERLEFVAVGTIESRLVEAAYQQALR